MFCYLQVPCKIAPVNSKLINAVENAASNLSQDGMTIEMDGNFSSIKSNVVAAVTTPQGRALEAVKKAMVYIGHALYRGEIYYKHPKGIDHRGIYSYNILV